MSIYISTTSSLLLCLLLPMSSLYSWEYCYGSLSLNNILLELSIGNSSKLFMITICMISLVVIYWSRFYMLKTMSNSFFYFFLLAFIYSMVLLLLSNSILSIFLGWEGLGITSFLLVIFYQNWMSCSGGLLTMLTNRIGDAILLICLCYWLLTDMLYFQFQSSSSQLFLLFLLASFTKSAQVPFTSWLPAAMAAPTPVSALVHSSTLVTAGVWLMIRFMQSLLFSTTLWLLFGVATLLMASLTAVKESDAKKVVALSTLSQLGLLFISLALSGKLVCLFHVITHAFAKANLFLGVGSLLHFRFSQQDSRYICSSVESITLFLSLGVSILGLIGMSFYSGFFSKEMILSGEVSSLNSSLVYLMLISVIAMTLSYCMIFMSSLMSKILTYSSANLKKSKFYGLSILLLAFITVFMGYSYFWNTYLAFLSMTSMSGTYWIILAMSIWFFKWNYMDWLVLFILQKKLVTFWSHKIKFVLKMSSHVLSSLLEPWYLTISLYMGSFVFSQMNRILVFSLLFSVMTVGA